MNSFELNQIIESVENAESLNKAVALCAAGLTELILSVGRDAHLLNYNRCVLSFSAMRVEELKKLEKMTADLTHGLCELCRADVNSDKDDWETIAKTVLIARELSGADENQILQAYQKGTWMEYAVLPMTIPERCEATKQELATLLDNCGSWISYWHEIGRNPLFESVNRCSCSASK